MKHSERIFRRIIILGDCVFILWILFNAIDSGFKGTPVEIASFTSLVILLLLNAYFLYCKNKS